MTGIKFTLQLHLKEAGFIYSACGPFPKQREKNQNFRETGNLTHLYKNELDKACFPHDVAYSDTKDLGKRTIPDKILKDRAYEIARNRNYHGYQRALTSMVYKSFWEKTGSGISAIEQLAEKLQKPVIKKFKRRKIYARFQFNIWATNLPEMETLFSKNKSVKYLLCMLYIFTKHA